MRSLHLRFGWFPLLAVAACSLLACGGGHDELAKRLAGVQSDLIKVQSHADRLEQRLEALEMRKEPAAPAPRPESATNLDGPRLTVVKLEPDDAAREAPANAPTAALRPEDSAADQSPRPMIRVYGSRTDISSASDNSKHKR